ncbi:MAG: phenylacetate-CoA oxygenase subunit PaaJ [Gammaproteobacteria bacterium]|nr:phenylacetate-CoA oxygenase subunit PaaJ [Gammaproteobacteria bacterium]
MLDEAAVWQVLADVPDPEIPAIAITELGIVRAVECLAGAVTVTVTPTYAGCPATEVIHADIRRALLAAGAVDVHLRTQLAPPWTTDWLSAATRAKLNANGIAPPCSAAASNTHALVFRPRVRCPRCHSQRTECLSAFGATACKALYRCLECHEPFEYFKPL